MEIKGTNQVPQALQRGISKGDASKGSFHYIKDSFTSSKPRQTPQPDLKTAAGLLMKSREPEKLEVDWTSKVKGKPCYADDSKVVLGGMNDRIAAVDKKTGDKLWISEFEGFAAEGKNGEVFAAEYDGGLHSLDPKTGKEIWGIKLEGSFSIKGVGKDGTIYADSRGKNIFYAIDPKDGKIKWECPKKGASVIGPDETIYTGTNSTFLAAYDPKTKKEKWIFKTDNVVWNNPTLGKEGNLYAGDIMGKLYAVDSNTGEKKWVFKATKMLNCPPAVGPDGTVYAGSNDKHLYAVDNETGKLKWKFKAGSAVTQTPKITDDGLILLTTGKTIYAIKPETGKAMWEKNADEYFTAAPLLDDKGVLYAGFSDSSNCAFKAPLNEKEVAKENLKKAQAAAETEKEKKLEIKQAKGYVEIGGIKLKKGKE